jgi:hypothetical protein
MMMNVWRTACAVLFFASSTAALALGPHECIILVNRRSMESVELANFYAELRQIPAANIIQLELPEKARWAQASFTPEEFRQHIYEPVRKTLRERNISGHIMAWLYSLDFPTTIETTPPMSLTGITFVRGIPPSTDDIEKGTWLSPFFRGPDRADGPASPPTSLEQFTLVLSTNMPIPSMMLGWTGSRGLTMEEIKRQLRASAASDGAQPAASVFFETSEDVRTQARAWQFESVTRELAGLGVAAFTGPDAPKNRVDMMGVLAGTAAFNSTTYGVLRPGAYADHLTSFAARFDDPYQTKLTDWLRRGAAASSGTVSEPYANWAKFPAARLFTFYASGCTIMESLFMSTRSPLQILFVGDALANPWAKPPGITLINMADDENAPIIGKGQFLASTWGGFGQAPPSIIFFLDGRPVSHPGHQPNLDIDTAILHDGYHEMRVVAYAQESVRHQGSDILTFTSRNLNRNVAIGGYTSRQKVDLYHPLKFEVSAEGNPIEAAIIAQERVLARAPYTTNMVIELHPMLVGAGPVKFQAVAVYADKKPVRSEPLLLEILPLNEAPVISSIGYSTNSENALVASMQTGDAEQDPVTTSWYADILRDDSEPSVSPAANLLELQRASGLTLTATGGPVNVTFEFDQPNRLRELLARFEFGEHGEISTRHEAGIVFNYIDEQNYFFWGVNGHLSAWTLTRVRDGNKEVVFSRGDYIPTDKPYTLMVAALNTQKIGFFVNDDVQGVADLSFSAGRAGVFGSMAPVRFDYMLASPPSAFRSFFAEHPGGTSVDAGHQDKINHLYGGVKDVQFTRVKPLVTPE